MKIAKHILFIYVGLPLGGIETLFVRLAEGLSARGYRISVLLSTQRGSVELKARLSKVAKIAYLEQFLPDHAHRLPDLPLLRMCMKVNGRALEQWLGGVPDFCHAADTGSVLLATRLSEAARIGPLTIGVYHDREYFFEDQLTHSINLDVSTCIRETPPNNLLFFNETSVKTHVHRFDLDQSKITICPIGVDLTRFSKSLLAAQSNRLVSVGRLTPFKTYNWVMLDVIANLNKLGISMTYDIWGDGELRPILEKRIAELGLDGQVALKGSLAYDAMERALEGCLAFIGSGTALIEASAAGLPAIAAIENEPSDRTYGCLHDFSGLSYHDASLSLPVTTFGERILALRRLSAESFAAECQAAKRRARDFSLELTLDRFEGLSIDVVDYYPKAGRKRALTWLLATAATKVAERFGRRSPFIHRHTAAT